MKRNKIVVSLFVLAFLASGIKLSAQTKDDAGAAFNAALELSKTNQPEAIKRMAEVVSMCEKIGPEADDLKESASKVLAPWQYQVANNFLKEKNIDGAMQAFESSLDLAKKYNDENIKEKSENQLAKVYFSRGNALSKAEDYDNAIAYYDKAIGFDQEYAKAYLMKGQAYKKKGDAAKMDEAMESAMTYATKDNDTVTIANVKKVMSSDLLSRANKAFQKEQFGEAIKLGEQSLSYDSRNKEAYYLVAVSYNKINQYDNAIDQAQKGLEFEDKTNEKQARFFFEIARAYQSKNDVGNACANYKKAAFGANASAANYQIQTVLKCK